MRLAITSVLLLLLSSVARVNAELEIPPGVMPADGRAAPALKLTDMDGESFDLVSKRGSWVLVHFWAGWCGPCRREMPTIQSLTEQISELPLEILLVNTAETDDDVFNFLSIAAPDLSTLMDYDGAVTEVWQPRGLPASFIVDPRGRIQYIALGGRIWDSPEYVIFLSELVASGSP